MNWDGLLLVNKPAGTTSHTVVQAIKKRLRVDKAGHLGTLDPLATGVFPVCLGKATRLSHFYMKADKAYLTAVKFGYFTTTVPLNMFIPHTNSIVPLSRGGIAIVTG